MDTNSISNRNNSSKIIFITGGTKSGKSEFAEHLAKNIRQITYIALSRRDQKTILKKNVFIEKEDLKVEIN